MLSPFSPFSAAARRLVDRGFEMDVAAAAFAALGQDELQADTVEIEDQFFIGKCLDHGPGRDLQDDVGSVFPGTFFASARTAAFGLDQSLVFEIAQGLAYSAADQDDIAAVAAVTAVRAAVRDEFLAAEAQAAVAAVAGAEMILWFGQ